MTPEEQLKQARRDGLRGVLEETLKWTRKTETLLNFVLAEAAASDNPEREKAFDEIAAKIKEELFPK